MRKVCPNNPDHNIFITTVHIVQEWKVDGEGDYIEVVEDGEEEITHGPDTDNSWVCDICGAEAITSE